MIYEDEDTRTTCAYCGKGIVLLRLSTNPTGPGIWTHPLTANSWCDMSGKGRGYVASPRRKHADDLLDQTLESLE